MDAAALDALADRLRASPALAAKADIGAVAARLRLTQGAIPVGDDCAAIPDGMGIFSSPPRASSAGLSPPIPGSPAGAESWSI